MSNVLFITNAKLHGEGVFQRRTFNYLRKTEKENVKKKRIKSVNVSRETRWIHSIMRTLIKTGIMPVVYAAEPPKPQKPPPMKYKDLPIYKTPHYDYKAHIEDSQRCSNVNKKILQSIVFPRVQSFRKSLKTMVYGMTDELKLMKNEACEVINKNRKDFIRYMRSPDNDATRKGVVATGTVIGIYLASGSRNVPKKAFGAFAGAVCTGALCYPKETDDAVRTMFFYAGNVVYKIYAQMCNISGTKERVPCADEVPPQPGPIPKEKTNLRCIVKDEKKK